MTKQQIDAIFTYHAPHDDQTIRYEDIRKQAKVFALAVENACPDSREKSLALTAIQQAVMWANASIAINECEPSA